MTVSVNSLVGFAFLGMLTGLADAQLQTKPPTIGNCPVFPVDNIWNTRIDQLPVSPNSSTWVNTIGTSAHLHPDFGFPYMTVPRTQTKYPATFTSPRDNDPGPYAIPLNAPIEGGSSSKGDRHVISVDTDNCILYEIYAAYPQAAGWHGGSGAIFNLRSDALRPAPGTSADAAGLPIFPGLVKYAEIVAGQINHAIRFTAPQTRNMYVWPARHGASLLTSANYPPMGARFRLKASFDTSDFSESNQTILTALKLYGMMLADNGSAWYIAGAPDPGWDDDDLHVLTTIDGSNFEAVDVSPLMVNPNSGQALLVSVTPPTAKVRVNGRKQFSATVIGNSTQAITWDVNGVVGGNNTVGFINSTSGLYTAPSTIPAPATVTVHAVSQTVASASVTVTRSAWAVRAVATAIVILVFGVALVAVIGYILPINHLASRSAHFQQPPRAIWDVITGPPDWRPDIRGSEKLSASDGRRTWKEFDKRGHAITYESVDEDPPRRLVTRIADPTLPYGGTWTFAIEAEPTGCQVTITEAGEIYNPIFRFMARFVFGYSGSIQTYLQALHMKFGETGEGN